MSPSKHLPQPYIPHDFILPLSSFNRKLSLTWTFVAPYLAALLSRFITSAFTVAEAI
jgi:hypothetical protein